MKIISKLCLIFATLLIVSCVPDDDNNNSVSDSIIGEWQLTSIVFGVGTFEEPLDDCARTQIYNFTENGSINRYYEASSDCDLYLSSDSYNLEDNQLTINSDIGGQNGFVYTERNTIETLNATTLKYVEIWNSIDGDLLPESRSTYTYLRFN